MARESFLLRDPRELGDEARLADARLAAHVDHGAANAGAKQRGQLRELGVAADERRSPRVRAPTERIETPRGHRPRETLDRKRGQRRALRLAGDGIVDRAVNDDLAWSRDADEPR